MLRPEHTGLRFDPLLGNLALQCNGRDRFFAMGFAHVIAGLCLQIYRRDPNLMVPLLLNATQS